MEIDRSSANLISKLLKLVLDDLKNLSHSERAYLNNTLAWIHDKVLVSTITNSSVHNERGNTANIITIGKYEILKALADHLPKAI